METMIGTIMAVGFDYAPDGWAICNGQTLSIQNNMALYSLLNTVYGGDGKTTFALPDLRGRTIVGGYATAKKDVTPVLLGAKPGAQSVITPATGTGAAQITIDNLPAGLTGAAQINGLQATSTLYATSSGPGPTTPAPGATAPSSGAMLSSTGTGGPSAAIYYTNPTPSVPLPTVALNAASVTTALGGTASFTAQIGAAAPAALPVALTTVTTTPVMQPSLGLTYLICINGYYPTRN